MIRACRFGFYSLGFTYLLTLIGIIVFGSTDTPVLELTKPQLIYHITIMIALAFSLGALIGGAVAHISSL